ncbi:MAG: DUF1858 domain-containing protein [Thermoplasmata archaeon]
MKEIDLGKSLYDITEQYPELIPVLKELGFAGVSNPVARSTLGRATTIPQGCERLGIELEMVLEVLRNMGYGPRF